MPSTATDYQNKVVEDVGDNGANAQYELVFPSDATGGHFTATYSGIPTGNVAWPSLSSVLQTALQGLGNIGAGNVAVTPGTRGYIVEFIGALAATPMAEGVLSADGSALTPTPGAIAVAMRQAGRGVFLTSAKVASYWAMSLDSYEDARLQADLYLRYLHTRLMALEKFRGDAWPQIDQQTGDEHRQYSSQFLHIQTMIEDTRTEIDRRLDGFDSAGVAAKGQPLFGAIAIQTPSKRPWRFGHGIGPYPYRDGCR